MSEKYRFENGALFIYDKDDNSYIHCYKNAFANTKEKAIKAYEEESLYNQSGEHLLSHENK